MSMFKITMTALAAMLLGGCALGPDYQRPEQSIPQQFRDQAAALSPDSVGEMDWRNVYTAAELQQLIERALAANLDLQMAASRIEQVEAQLGIARIGQLPQLSGAGSVGRSQTARNVQVPSQPHISENANLSVNLSWELDFWGRLRRLTEAARAEYLGTQYARQALRVSLIANVSSAYYTLCALDDRITAARHSLETREAFLELTQAQFQRGVTSELDVLTAQAQRAAAQASIYDLQRQATQTENALGVLLAQPLQPVTRGACSEPLAQTPTGLPSRLLERRPDILQAEQGMVAANARIGAAKAALFPSVSLTGAFGAVSRDVSDLLHSGSESWSVGVGLLQPLFNVDRNLYQVDLARARTREAVLNYEKVVRSAFAEVANALVGQQRNRQILQAQQDQVSALRKAEAMAQARYKGGYSSYFDVINANRDLFTAEQGTAQARLGAQLATIELYRALGGGWDVPSAQAP